jgi:hypothetical protein
MKEIKIYTCLVSSLVVRHEARRNTGVSLKEESSQIRRKLTKNSLVLSEWFM